MTGGSGQLTVDGKKIAFYQEKDPAKLPWRDLKIDIVIESTGIFTSAEKAKGHLDAGAKHVVITAPAKGDPSTGSGQAGVETILIGANEGKFGFSLFYLKETTVEEFPQGDTLTITFQNIERVEGFQIFIVPFSGSQVSEERFRQDVPSGVRKDLTDATIDGAVGAAFYSENENLGETREVWFIHGGYLYEVTTLKSLDCWLQEVMQTWKFFL